MSPFRVILVDDHNLVRAGILALLKDIPDVEIVAETFSGTEGLRLIEAHRPDIILLDISLPDITGLEVARQVRQAYPEIKILFLSMFANEEYVWQAMQLGAAGYLLKDATTTELGLAFQAVARGEAYLSPAVSRRVIDGYVKRVSPESHPEETESSPGYKLTPRQSEILQLIADGFTTKEIAQKLTLSVKTVEAHRSQLMRELSIHDIAGLVRYAIRSGLVSDE